MGSSLGSDVICCRGGQPGVRDLLVDPLHEDHLYLSYSGGLKVGQLNVARAVDPGSVGKKWSDLRVSQVGGDIELLCIDNGWLYVAQGATVFRRGPTATDWDQLVPSGLETELAPRINDPHDLAVDPTSNQSTIYAPTKGNGIAKSTDGGVTWTRINQGLRAAETSLVTALSEPEGGLIVNGARDAYRSYDWGQSWELLPVPLKLGTFDEIAESPISPDRVWIAADKGFSVSTPCSSIPSIRITGSISWVAPMPRWDPPGSFTPALPPPTCSPCIAPWTTACTGRT